jgi:pyruvate formate lyase activating enzyme
MSNFSGAITCDTSNDTTVSGLIFNIQRYSLHDGAGIRTLVFMKGCPLRCHWCSNPESQLAIAQIILHQQKCLGANACGWCLAACQQKRLSITTQGGIQLQQQDCQACQACVENCPNHALQRIGRQMSAEQVIDEVEKDAPFYARSSGGLTLSGGEPLMQADFALAILQEAKRRHLHTTLETCGYGAWTALQSLAGYCDQIYFDIKHLDDKKHRQGTGRSVQPILHNLRQLRKYFPQLAVHVRTPLIPDFNHDSQAINQIIDFILPLNVSYEILPYHRLGRDKYHLLGRLYELEDKTLSMQQQSQIMALARVRLGAAYRPS